MVDNNEEYPGNRLKNVSRSSFNGQPLMLSKTDRRLVIRLEKRFNCFVEQFCFVLLFFFPFSQPHFRVCWGKREVLSPVIG